MERKASKLFFLELAVPKECHRTLGLVFQKEKWKKTQINFGKEEVGYTKHNRWVGYWLSVNHAEEFQRLAKKQKKPNYVPNAGEDGTKEKRGWWVCGKSPTGHYPHKAKENVR